MSATVIITVQWLSTGGDCTPQGTSGNIRRYIYIFDWTGGGGQDAANHPTAFTPSPPPTKNYPAY